MSIIGKSIPSDHDYAFSALLVLQQAETCMLGRASGHWHEGRRYSCDGLFQILGEMRNQTAYVPPRNTGHAGFTLRPGRVDGLKFRLPVWEAMRQAVAGSGVLRVNEEKTQEDYAVSLQWVLRHYTMCQECLKAKAVFEQAVKKIRDGVGREGPGVATEVTVEERLWDGRTSSEILKDLIPKLLQAVEAVWKQESGQTA